jgi:hypothetical protein
MPHAYATVTTGKQNKEHEFSTSAEVPQERTPQNLKAKQMALIKPTNPKA